MQKCAYVSNKRPCSRVQRDYMPIFPPGPSSILMLRVCVQRLLKRGCAYAQTRLSLLCSLMRLVLKPRVLAQMIQNFYLKMSKKERKGSLAEGMFNVTIRKGYVSIYSSFFFKILQFMCSLEASHETLQINTSVNKCIFGTTE